MLKALEENPGRWDLSTLKLIVSSGVMWSREVKQGLLKHHPGMLLADMFGSSEAVGFGTSVTSAQGESRTARFVIGESCKVFTEDHREVVPGSGERGFIARSGPIPLGYHKDPKKTAETFPVIDGVRYAMPGDFCTVEADGSLTLLGRGSVCINTAGEKVHPEEVEEALKTHPDVEDALVFGLPDEKWGQAVTAVVQLHPGRRLRRGAAARPRARASGRLQDAEARAGGGAHVPRAQRQGRLQVRRRPRSRHAGLRLALSRRLRPRWSRGSRRRSASRRDRTPRKGPREGT